MRAANRVRGAAAALAGAVIVLAAVGTTGTAVFAREGTIGPCSPYRAVDGDIPSEMPGCARRLRPAPGSLADELQFRRARNPGDEEAEAPEDGPQRWRPKRVPAR